MHVTHMFQLYAKSRKEAENLVASMLDDADRIRWDYYGIEGTLDVAEDKYYPEGEDEPESGSARNVIQINKNLEHITSQETYNEIKRRLLEYVVLENWFPVGIEAMRLDGIRGSVGKKFDVANRWDEVNSNNYCEFGLSSIGWPGETGKKRFIVFVDFHI